MKAFLGVCVALLLACCLSACSSSDRTSAAASSIAPSTPMVSDSLSAPVRTTSAAADDLGPGDPCNLFVGLPLSRIYTDDGRGPQCITSTSLSNNNTGFSVSACDPLNEATSTKVVAWVSNDPAAVDQNEYAAYENGNIVIVPNASPRRPAALATILLAVGIAGCRPGT